MAVMPSRPNPGAPARIFLSYRRDDTRHMAGRLSDRLEDRFPNAAVFMDVETIEPGADFVASIRSAVGSCDVLIALIGQSWLDARDRNGRRRIEKSDDFVVLEIASALERNVQVIPVLVDGSEMPHPEELPEALVPLAVRHAVRLDHETFRTDIQRILSAVERTLRNAASRAEHPVVARSDLPTVPHQELTGSLFASRPIEAPATEEGPRIAPPPPDDPRAPTEAIPVQRRVSRIPVHRTILRIALWWVATFLALFACVGAATEIARPTGQLGTAIFAVALLLGLAALSAHFLRREITAQRRILDQARVALDDPSRRPLSNRHVRRVAAWCAVGVIGLAIAIALTPPAVPQSTGTSLTRTAS
jgi:hypothetical protein